MRKILPIEILRVRDDDDIPGLIFDGVVDLGIIGENVLEEGRAWSPCSKMKQLHTKKLRQLDFGDLPSITCG